jgi:hypothetical protein
MNKFCVTVMVLLVVLVGCGENTSPVDAASDAGVHDAEPPVVDASDAAEETDAGDAGGLVDRDGGGDGGTLPESDAGVPPSDASSPDASAPDAAAPDAGTSDAGTPPAPDAAVDAGPPVFGQPLKLEVSGNTTCVLDDRRQMWCWGDGVRTPQYVDHATDIHANCGLAEDHHIFCWTAAGVTDYTDVDASIAGTGNGWVRRSDGRYVMRIGSPMLEWAPPAPIAQMGTGMILSTGALWFFDLHVDVRPGMPTRYELRNFWEAVPASGAGSYDVTDVERVGNSIADDLACWQSSSGGSVCWNAPGFADRITSLSSRSTEIEFAGSDVCMLVTSREDGTGRPGVRCLDRSDFLGTATFPAYLESDGLSDLAGGDSHLCAIRGSDVVCWGGNSLGQLGDGTTTPRAAPTVVSF